MADTLERMTNLLALLLEARQPLTFEQINHDITPRYDGNASGIRAAFERDKAALRDAGVNIETEILTGEDAGRTGYRIDRARYELRGLQLQPDEQRALQLAVAAARNADARFGLLKLGGESIDAELAVVSAVELPAALPWLREAASMRAVVSFDYRGRRRTFDPYSVMLREGRWYAVGHDHEYDELRTYRVDRIESVIDPGPAGGFERPAGFDPRVVFPEDPKELGDEPLWAVVRIDRQRAPLVEPQFDPSAVHRRHDGSIDVDVPCANRDAFRSWLLGLGVHATVLGPPEVRADVVDWLRAVVGAS
jgi:proteasome accessory factor B